MPDNIELLLGQLADQKTEIARLRKGIQDYLDGSYDNPQGYRPGLGECKHGVPWYSGCAHCDCEHLQAVLDGPAIHFSQALKSTAADRDAETSAMIRQAMLKLAEKIRYLGWKPNHTEWYRAYGEMVGLHSVLRLIDRDANNIDPRELAHGPAASVGQVPK